MTIVKSHHPDNYIPNKMGIPAHDNVAFVYTGEVITSATYSLNDVVVATVIYTYNAGGDVTNIERTG
jgi:hypothetical protein|tara:strand:- start:1204 stop:1404 length:201 start_codon:yes stop_codon:yes gene_type:complete